MNTPRPVKIGLDGLLTPDNCCLMLIDHQPYQISAVKNIDTVLMINNVVALAKSAKTYGVPTLLTCVLQAKGGNIIKQLLDVFPEQTPFDRTAINAWQDERCVKWVQDTGRKKVVMAALWTEICLAMPVIHALGDGYEVYFVTDASGGTTVEAHKMAIQRMIQAGGIPITSNVLRSELRRDWANPDPGMHSKITLEHGGSAGTNLAWEQQLLASH